ncbi:S-methyl-5-thioribose-1-phosphate isomerase [Streptomyces leeuwenhoekii]|uniref:Multifunctional fusion protein n=1 Tax=Streptomyces leeuwenhoekii TaxID=1437453 RepID=A0A0F7VRV5_STRLW|nr:S-methyl-5-thioribose-1-phosphate isomerase [Streptomyces leeuwenhoekii]CQR59551.1 Probable bifunctional methylthioribose-1-phosphate isomerase/methylthioribulose-1-phosphate dehydratase [Streptomyces leeuwenhoekii]
MERSVAWEDDTIVTVDQRALPHAYRPLRLTTVDGLIDAITSLAIRGAPAIGVAGALGVAMSAIRHTSDGVVDAASVHADAARIAAARPTAVNLARGVGRALSRLADGPQSVLFEAEAMLREDEEINRTAARRAADLVKLLCPQRPLRVLTHCNTGRLATTAWGTALGAVRALSAEGLIEEVLVDETRPLLQGARLTTWELAEADIPHRLCVDSAGPAALDNAMVDCVLVGADRIAGNGDVANKVGTYSLAAAAARAGVPFVVVAPESTLDPSTATGRDIAIEERPADEVTHYAGRPVAPAGTPVFNPAFDITPHSLVTAVVTERAVMPGGRPTPSQEVAHEYSAGRSDPAVLSRRVLERCREIPDFPRAGVAFQDLGEVYRDHTLLGDIATGVQDRFRGRCDLVLALEARGFPLGAIVAQRLGTALVLGRKPGKLPGAVLSVDYGLEYGSDSLEVQEDAVPPGARVLVVDDVLATGGTLDAAIRLVEACGAEVCGLAVITELAELGGRARLRGHELFAASLVGVPHPATVQLPAPSNA